MPAELDLLPRLLAFESGRAFPRASHLQMAVHADGLVLCCLAMAGEDTTVHIAACGRVGQPARILCVPNPRVRHLQYALLDKLTEILERYFEECRVRATHPQIWVSSAAGVDHLGTLADYFRFNKDSASVKRLGELLAYATERHPHAGQQALFSSTSALQAHWATGQDVGEDEHLGSLLTWITPPIGRSIRDALAEVELVPMGVKTDPGFDRDSLLPLVESYNRARKQKVARSELKLRAVAVREALEPVVTRIYDETQRAIKLIRLMRLPPLPDLNEMERRESDEFESHMRQLDGGRFLPLRDRPRRAVFGLTAREDDQRNKDAAVLRGDHLARARAELSGHVLTGRVLNVRTASGGPRRTIQSFDLETSQRVLRVRLRDELTWLNDTRLRVQVTNVRRRTGATTVSVLVTRGQQAVGAPRVGTLLHLSKAVPDWGRLHRDRKHLADVLSTPSWTHESGSVPVLASRPAPIDPLASVEALR